MKHRILLFAAAIGALVITAQAAQACSCRQPTLASVSANSDVVLSGTVLAVRRVGHSQFGRLFATIRVGKIYKGRLPSTITVETRGNSAACGVNFKAGQQVRFGASSNGRNYATGLCSMF
jgi:hypothetical protein